MPASNAARKTPEPNMQRKETLNKVLCWQAETTVSYLPEGKRAGTASFVRYERYSKATTVGEALQLGSSAEDLINDYMKGILKVTGGPMREKPLEQEDVLRGEGLTETDKQLGKFLKNFHRIELASQLGMDSKAVASKRSWCESPVMHAKRLMAQRAAEEVLKQVEESGGQVTDEHVLDLLRKWAFRRNATRRNVAPADRPVVDSDTFGVMRNQAGVWIVTHATRDYPAVTKLLVRWLLDTLPMQDICVTSIHVNSGFAARRHRDRDNLGPAFMRALGDFTEGGQLWYWPDDDGLAAVERLPEELRVTLDMRAAPAIIDGNRAHEVEPFKGERFGIVFYTANKSQKIPKAIADELASYGFRMPDKEGIEAAKHFFAPPKGYGLEPAESTGPPKRSAGEDAGSRPGLKRSRKGAAAKRTGESLLAKLRQNATQKEEEAGNAGGAKDARKGSLKQAVFKTNLKQAVLKLKGKEDPKGKLGALKVKTKAVAAGGLLSRMMAKRAQRVEEGSGPQEGGEDAATKSAAEPAEKDKKSADGNGAKGTSGAMKPSKVVPGGLLARVIAAKEAKAPPAAPAAPASDPEGAAGESGQDTPQRKRSNSAGASRSGSSGPPSTKKQKPPGKESGAGKEASKAKSSSKAGKSGSEEAKAATEETKAPCAGPAEGAAPQNSPEPPAPTPAPPAAAPVPAAAAPAAAAARAPMPLAAVAPAPPAAAAPAVPAVAAVAVPAAAPMQATAAPAPRAVPETVRTAAAVLGLSAASGSGLAGREAVNCQHFLLLANVMRAVEENPSTTISTLADYFQVLLRMAETPELLLRTALDLLLPAGAAPQEAVEAAISGAFGAAAGQMAKEKGLPEAAQEGRRAKRSLRAPPPRLTLPEVAEALAAARGGDGASLARALGATRPEGREAFFLVKALQGAAGASMGDVHAAVAKAMVCAAGAA